MQRSHGEPTNRIELLADLVATLTEGFHREISTLSHEELTWQPDGEGNSIGVTVWHCSRGLDVLKTQFLEHKPALAEQWHTQGWVQITGYDPRGIGTGGFGMLSGYNAEEVAAIPVLSVEELLMYLDQVASALRHYLLSMPEYTLSQPSKVGNQKSTVYQLIREIIMGCIGHLGEVEALKAMQVRAQKRAHGQPHVSHKLAVVKRLFDAVHRRDRNGVLETYHPDIVIHEAPSLPYGGEFHGHEEALRHLNGYFRTQDTLPSEDSPQSNSTGPRNLFIDTVDDYVIVFWRVRAIDPQSGKVIDLPEIGAYKVRSGKVVESWMFPQDTAAVLEYLKQAER